MNTQELVAHLCQHHPPEVIYEISFETVISMIVHRLGEEALELSAEALELASDEVTITIDHHLDERDLIAIGLDSWEIVRNL